MPWYKAGTATVTLNSATVTGAGTAWVDNTRIGDAFIGPDGLVYEITARASDTSLTIAPPYKSATGSARPYVIAPMQGYVKTLADQAALLLTTAEPALAAGTTAQYYRGDKTWQTLNNTAVGLGSVNNTSDANKPVSTAQQTALNLKANTLSPTLTGTPAAPTAAAGTNTTQLATTAYALAAAALRYGKNNILGTVSQSAGVPTGAVIERGSNANGVYWRFAGGLQICLVTHANLFVGANLSAQTAIWTYPATFASTPAVHTSCYPLSSSDHYGFVSSDAAVATAQPMIRNGAVAQTFGGIVSTATGAWY